MRRAGIVFVDAFLGSLVTLLVSSTFVEIDSDTVPDSVILLEMILAAMIAGIIALIGVARTILQEEIGEERKDA
jgi:hypothetical protein